MVSSIKQVLIPSAGIGSRLGSLTKNINKALIQIDGKAVISHIIDLYPENYEFIICLGHKGDLLRQYLEISHPKTKFKFVNIDKFDGPGSGLGYTLRKTKDLIDSPFYFHTNDAIFNKKIPNFDDDTILLSSNLVDSRNYRTASIDETKGIISELHDKTQNKLLNVFTYTGVAYIKNYKDFIRFLDTMSVEIGESDYFIKKIGGETNYYLSSDWMDIGSIDGINTAKAAFGGFKNLDKTTEEIYFIDKNVIKFDINDITISQKVERSKKLKKVVPKVLKNTNNFFLYKYVEGDLVADLLSPNEIFEDLLIWCEKNLWKQIKLNKSDEYIFKSETKNFYFDKTFDRINFFNEEYGYFDRNTKINGTPYPKLEKILNEVDWDNIFDALPCHYHGDLHFENILKTDKGYCLLDWRGSYGNTTLFGDIYYDLGKLLHGLWINHKIIRDDHYEIRMKGSTITFDVYQKKSLIDCQKILKEYAFANNYSWRKIETIASLILLNIAPLHHDPYSKLLYFFGKEQLQRIVNEYE